MTKAKRQKERKIKIEKAKIQKDKTMNRQYRRKNGEGPRRAKGGAGPMPGAIFFSDDLV